MPFVELKYEDIIFDQKVQEMCISPGFSCPYYNHSWSCPPVAPYMENIISRFDEFFLIYSQFDLEGYIKNEKKKNPRRSEFYIKNTFLLKKTFLLNDLEGEFDRFLMQYEKNYSKILLLYDGTCRYCLMQNAGPCTYDAGEPCRFPEERRYSMEAVGIDVIQTVKHLRLEVDYPSNKYSYRFGLACIKKSTNKCQST
jgi:predicted metal-binding protein